MSESPNLNFDQPFSTAIPTQAPAAKKPKKKRIHRSLIHHERQNLQAERREKNAKTFEQVLLCYVEVSSLSPLGAFSIDPTARRNGLTYLHVEWLVDVQHCAKTVLSPYLHKKWLSLLSIESEDMSEGQKQSALSAVGITPQVMHRLQQKLGQVFHSRELKPGRYFTQIRRRNRFEQIREQQITFLEAKDSHESSLYKNDDEPVPEGGDGYSFGQIESESYE